MNARRGRRELSGKTVAASSFLLDCRRDGTAEDDCTAVAAVVVVVTNAISTRTESGHGIRRSDPSAWVVTDYWRWQ